MREFRLSFPACVIAGKQRLDHHDVVLLKTYGLPHGVCSHEDALTLLVLNGCCPDKCAEWQGYFIDSMASYILRKHPPENRIDTYKLQWLISTFTTDGKANSPIEQRLLQHISMMMADLQSESGQTPDLDGVTEKTVVSSVHPLKRQARELRSRFSGRSPKEEKSLPLQQPKKRFALG
ncbi:hypothetical protein GOZ78_02320 [Agrobacterium vitis]|uniref:Uncharacterized protein n=1 Tax=Agrobacterium vitis TaxID=373 RepID=A0ABD6GC70_AGRVI|nr:hypothetical protein [Agrobacterium vitis]MUO77731.1 hypothetical protein [Agrobacterium vitis]MUO93248.1 hypothetical protein [Agrobacterium vitis]MUP04599.1 hypothetical protein [Agrobacterium vitis]MUZ80964.1 hypothetical protein [Agrobacterium vitis]MVA08851.1 hypothetical protein [Agrobacterium vitis]